MMDGGLEKLRGHDLLYKVLFQVISLKRCSKFENRDLGIAKMFGFTSRGIHVVCVCGDIMYYYHIILGWEQQYI